MMFGNFLFRKLEDYKQNYYYEKNNYFNEFTNINI